MLSICSITFVSCKCVKKQWETRQSSLIMTSDVLGLRRFNDLDGQSRSEYLPITGEVQNVKQGNVYVFANADVTEEEINTNNAIELSELRVRGKHKTHTNAATGSRTHADNGQNSFIERIIIPSDTLQLFALQYGCPVSEIKRINKLINDQDFYALTKIKIPVRQHGLLQDEEEERRRRPLALNAANALTTSCGSLDEEPTSPSDESCSDEHYYRTISIQMKDESDKKKFLKRMDKDIQKICQQNKTSKDSLDEVTKELTVTRFYPLNETRNVNKISWLTWDLSWKSLILIIAALLFVMIVVISRAIYLKFHD